MTAVKICFKYRFMKIKCKKSFDSDKSKSSFLNHKNNEIKLKLL